MQNEIVKFLKGVSLKNSERKARQMVAEHFGGATTSNHRYVKIGDEEFSITKNPDDLNGWDVRKMDWKIGNDWKFFSPY